MLVAELQERIASQEDRLLHAELKDVRVSEDAAVLEITGTFEGDSDPVNVEFPFDELAEASISRFLDVNKTYIHKCPPNLKALNVNHWLNANAGTEAVFSTGRGMITSVHEEGLNIIPIQRVGRVITNVFNERDEIVGFERSDRLLQIDVKVENSSIEVPNPDRIEGRPEVGDITHGGVRVLTYPQEVMAPVVTPYLHRVWCRNGSCEDYAANTIRIRGNTVEEVIAEMEYAAQTALSNLDQKLQEYANMANTPIPGSPSDFVFQIAAERQVGTRMTRRLMERALLLPSNATLYDVQQLFTTLANEGRLNSATLLQTIGGDLAFRTEQMIHRCSQCERIL